MPCLPNARQELYCKHRANGFVPRRAAQAAGFATGSSIYSELEAAPEIMTRIQELLDQRNEQKQAKLEAAMARAAAEGQAVGQLTGVGHAWVVEQLKLNAEEAREAGSFKESNDALKLIGEHIGMWGKGGSVEGENGGGASAPQLIDLDVLDRLGGMIDDATGDKPKELPLLDHKVMMGLIEGQTTKVKRDRAMVTGSETDIVFTDDALGADDLATDPLAVLDAHAAETGA